MFLNFSFIKSILLGFENSITMNEISNLSLEFDKAIQRIENIKLKVKEMNDAFHKIRCMDNPNDLKVLSKSIYLDKYKKDPISSFYDAFLNDI